MGVGAARHTRCMDETAPICPACGSEAMSVERYVEAAQDEDGNRVAVITNVPRHRCPVCGHTSLDSITATQVSGQLGDGLRRNRLTVVDWRTVPVSDQTRPAASSAPGPPASGPGSTAQRGVQAPEPRSERKPDRGTRDDKPADPSRVAFVVKISESARAAALGRILRAHESTFTINLTGGQKRALLARRRNRP
jgi:YgiT-type zinc finger domain-containing protein